MTSLDQSCTNFWNFFFALVAFAKSQVFCPNQSLVGNIHQKCIESNFGGLMCLTFGMWMRQTREGQNLPGKLEQQSAIWWNSLGLSRDYGLKYIFLGIKLFCFSRQKAETFSICLKKNFVKSHKISIHSAHSDNFYFHFFLSVV